MKKIILFLTILSLGVFLSCSSDDGNSGESPSPTPQSTVTTKINGVQKNFSTIQVVPVVYTDYTDLEVTATLTGSSPATLEMNLEKDSPDSSVYFFQYTENGIFYQPSESFAVIITQNSDNKLKGSFSGTLIDTGDPMNTIAVTEGTFDIKY
ncbi:MAG: hypothetical protein KAY31_04955 [Flavobacterium sp.]|nr:hypothetical protein [Flavobacterium sp.]